MGDNPIPVISPPAIPVAPSEPSQTNAQATVTLTPVFKLVFSSVLSITLICLIVSVFLALRTNPSNTVKSLDEKVLSVFTLGCGAIIGLLGGKTLN